MMRGAYNVLTFFLIDLPSALEYNKSQKRRYLGW